MNQTLDGFLRVVNDWSASWNDLVRLFGCDPAQTGHQIRQTRKRGGIGIGVASDEPRRYGLNAAKRARLIRAGADMVIPDFSQLDQLRKILGLGAK